ncbi:MAG: hypothetical protein ACTSQ4_02160 [Candidatus Heimdallarchaeaceae archaeon]
MGKITKADVEKARKRFHLKLAQQQLGSHIKSLDQVKVVSRAKKPKFSLGIQLQKIAKRR